MHRLITDIDAFCEAHSIAPTTFGLLALNDKAFVGQIKNGRQVLPKTEDRVRDFMEGYHAPTDSPAAVQASARNDADATPRSAAA